MNKKSTIRDVAQLAGVSVATASRVLSDSGYRVSERTAQRVREAAQSLDYVPNDAARALRRESNRDIALVIPNVSNPFYLQAMLGIDDVLRNNARNMILCNTMSNVELEHLCLRQLYERQAWGVILSSVDENAEQIERYRAKGMKFVMLDQMMIGQESMGICFDSRAGARMATDHLIGRGHRRIAFATLPQARWTRTEMLRGYTDALSAAGLPFDASLVYEGRPDREEARSNLELRAGQWIARAFMRDGCPATAILCINDMLAIGVMQTLMKSGVRVPDDVSVMGFDDIPLAEIYLPALTTVRYPAVEAGRMAALLMLDSLSDQAFDPHFSMQVSPQLVIRDSVKDADARRVNELAAACAPDPL
ncbi:MAG: LacI family DNA-binding transcriptional regulator [Clostridia bacterium]|nr:LacI family DNA-binding transcriptional regulator [Clostridia bacterium]